MREAGDRGSRRWRDKAAVNQIGRPTCSRLASPSACFPPDALTLQQPKTGPWYWDQGDLWEGRYSRNLVRGTLLSLNPKTETLMYQA